MLVLLLLQIKHWYVDFVMQTPEMVAGKGIYANPKGVLHSAQHGIATLIILALFIPLPLAAALALFDFVTHYHIDWAKMNLNKRLGWGPTTHEQFWWLLGLDQFLHALTYIGLIYLVTGV